jgi:hypothetical protein
MPKQRKRRAKNLRVLGQWLWASQGKKNGLQESQPHNLAERSSLGFKPRYYPLTPTVAMPWVMYLCSTT